MSFRNDVIAQTQTQSRSLARRLGGKKGLEDLLPDGAFVQSNHVIDLKLFSIKSHNAHVRSKPQHANQ